MDDNLNTIEVEKKNPLIKLPLKVILTEEGIDFFRRNKKRPRRFRMADNVVEYGFPLTIFTPFCKAIVCKTVLPFRASSAVVSNNLWIMDFREMPSIKGCFNL